MLADGSLMSVSLYKKLVISCFFTRDTAGYLPFFGPFRLILPCYNYEGRCWLLGPQCYLYVEETCDISICFTRDIADTCLFSIPSV